MPKEPTDANEDIISVKNYDLKLSSLPHVRAVARYVLFRKGDSEKPFRGGGEMYLTVMYKNGEVGMVEAHRLDDLIASGEIEQFLRSDGWVRIGIDPVREQEDALYKGPERRTLIRKFVRS